MLLEQVHQALGWPTPGEVFEPRGVGIEVVAGLAREKLGRAIARLPEGEGVRVGVLTTEPNATVAPIAIVCEFPRPVGARTLLETHKLAWNFNRSLLLITIEPHLIRSWSCSELPEAGDLGDATLPVTPQAPEILRIDLAPDSANVSEQAAASLSWVELASGHFFQRYAERFPEQQRADRMLLSNLRELRQVLKDQQLDDDRSHDLLARIIFVQFLFDRKDSAGEAALDPAKLHELHRRGVLSASYGNLAEILDHYDDAYQLFRWLNERFNGDLFPGKGATPEQREAEWRAEQDEVRPEHLRELAEFVRGDMEMRSGQRCLWPLYAFDAIPLEFISSIYESFVKGKGDNVGVHYTPPHLVDLMLDRILPWDSDDWNLHILDPACGSGIFLVKAFQRLIYRWKRAHRDTQQDIDLDVLARLLEHNLFGIDDDRHAVRVASFSLYLAMCDEIDPRHYWSDHQRVRFPQLRARRIVHSDFFAEDRPGFQTVGDAGSYDIVLGNPPWGRKTLKPISQAWARQHDWPTAGLDFGSLFVAKGLALLAQGGRLCMVQAASALLYNLDSTAVRVRRKIFREAAKVEGVVNLAAHEPFKDVRVPTCVLIVRKAEPDGDAFWYECPKRLHTSEDVDRFIIDPHDVHLVYPDEIETGSWIWSALMWGGERDRALIRKLNESPNLEKLQQAGHAKTREGLNWGDRTKRWDAIVGRRVLQGTQFPPGSPWYLRADDLAVNEERFHHSRDSSSLEPFALPQLLVKTSWTQSAGRFQARLVRSRPDLGGVLCSQSFLTIHVERGDESLMQALCACYNSDLATYYLLLTSGRFAFSRTEPLTEELRRVPLPTTPPPDVLEGITSREELDRRVHDMLAVDEAEAILVEDLMRYTLPDYKKLDGRPGYQPTRRWQHGPPTEQLEPDLSAYCDTFRRVLAAAYGPDKRIGAVILSEPAGSDRLPARLVSIILNDPDTAAVRIEPLQLAKLRERLNALYGGPNAASGGQRAVGRCIRTYESWRSRGEATLIVNITKPDRVRYWTRSMALRDADEVAADLMVWSRGLREAEAPQSHEVAGER